MFRDRQEMIEVLESEARRFYKLGVTSGDPEFYNYLGDCLARVAADQKLKGKLAGCCQDLQATRKEPETSSTSIRKR